MRVILVLLMLLGISGPTALSAAQYDDIKGGQIVVQAGDQARNNSIVNFALPGKIRGIKGLKDARGRFIEVQVDDQGIATFIEESCQKGSYNTYDVMLVKPAEHQSEPVTAVTEGSRVRLMHPRVAPVYYQSKPSPLPDKDIKLVYQRGAYLHPIHSPRGVLISDDYPPKHLHHHGLWFAWTKTEFEGNTPDFWNMGEGTGRVEFAKEMMMSRDGPVYAALRSKHLHRELVSEEAKVVLEEVWEIRLYQAPKVANRYTVFDLSSRQDCATQSKLLLPPYHYGGLAFRGHRDWDGAENVAFLTSEGETDRVKANETRARWCYMGGQVKGQTAGIVIMGHPDNFRAPQPLRIHPDEPYFCFAPQQLGEMEITPDEPYVSHYRCVTLDGPPNRAMIERLYQDYANPPQVEIKE